MKITEVKKLMRRNPDSHKGESGHVLLIGGSENYVGALVLAGIAALRSGCDLVTIAAPEKAAWAINTYSPDLITTKLNGSYITPKHLRALKPLFKKCNVIALGNGMGTHWRTKRFCKKLMKRTKNKLKVVDADALKLLSLRDISNAILTPHARELNIILDNSGLKGINEIRNKEKKVHMLQRHLSDNVLLLKGKTDFIISKNNIKAVKGGNPGMAKSGTGDVLAGLCAGFLAQSGDLFKSAEAASAINKKIGDVLLKKKHGYSFIASDMVDEIKRLNTNSIIT